MVSISVILPTARESYQVMLGLPNMHMLYPCIESLKKQTFKDFEFIIVDCLFEHRNEYFSDLPFPIKHVPLHPNHRFWLEQKRCCAAEAVNTGIIHAGGELIVKVDDCCQFDSAYLEKIWEVYRSGYFPLSLYTKYRGGEQAYYTKEFRREEIDQCSKAGAIYEKVQQKQEQRLKLYGDGGEVRDSRWNQVVEKGRMIAPVNWFYGYSSFSRKAALVVNGFDETFDGDQAATLVDVDMGLRLAMAGYHNKFLLDKDIWVIEHEHNPVSPRVVEPGCGNIKCNYAIMIMNKRKNRWRANQHRFTEEELQFIREESLRPPCQWNPHQYVDNCQGEMFKLWANSTQIFDLRGETIVA